MLQNITGSVLNVAYVDAGLFMSALGTGYVQLLVVEMLPFTAMLGLAARDRYLPMPCLAGPDDPDEATTVLRRRPVLEATPIVALAAVGVRGLLDPAGAA